MKQKKRYTVGRLLGYTSFCILFAPRGVLSFRKLDVSDCKLIFAHLEGYCVIREIEDVNALGVVYVRWSGVVFEYCYNAVALLFLNK